MLLSVLDFRNRFSIEEKRAIYSAANQFIDIQIWLDDLSSIQGDVDTEDPRTIAGVQGLEAFGLIGVNRASEILGIPPEGVPTGGYTLGQLIRIKPPFNTQFSDTYEITGWCTNGVEILDSYQFDLSYVEPA